MSILTPEELAETRRLTAGLADFYPLLATLDAALAALREREWSEVLLYWSGDQRLCCLTCDQDKHEGHAPTCADAAILALARAATGGADTAGPSGT